MKFTRVLLLFLLISALNVFPQTIPVTLHYKPIIDDFTTLRLVGNFNGWNNNDPNMVMTDNDSDGVFDRAVDTILPLNRACTVQVAAASGHWHCAKYRRGLGVVCLCCALQQYPWRQIHHY